MKRTPWITGAIFLILLLQAACAASPANTAPTAASSAFGSDAAAPGICPADFDKPKPSGLIISVTTALGVQADTKTPTTPTSEFSTSATLHAVVAVKDAPAGTIVKAAWKAIAVADPSVCNSLLKEEIIETSGTSNLDYSLTPTPGPAWSPGSYKVEISVNGVLDQIVPFTVK
jgi:hypothetical protein